MSAHAYAHPAEDPGFALSGYPPCVDVPHEKLVRMGQPRFLRCAVFNALPVHIKLIWSLMNSKDCCRLEFQKVECHSTVFACPAIGVFHGPQRMLLGCLGVGETTGMLRDLGSMSVFGIVIPDQSHCRFTDFTLELYSVRGLDSGVIIEGEGVFHA